MPPRTSRLNRPQQRLVAVLVALGIFMLADTLYLLTNRLADALGLQYFAVTEISMPKFYQGLVLSHTGMGLILVALAVAFVLWHLPAVWRKNRRRAIYTGMATAALGLLLCLTGLFILSAAQSRDNAWAYWSHASAAALLPVFYLLHRRISLWKPSALSYRLVPVAVVGLLLAAVLLHGITYDREQYTRAAEEAFAAGTHLGPGSRERDLATFVEANFVPANFVPFQSPFFPAATTTTTGAYLPSRIITRGDLSQPEKLREDIGRYGFVVDEPIGSETCARCHADVVEQWSKSAHRSLLDEDGDVLALSGAIGEDGHVDERAHFYKALLVDRHSEAVHKRNAQDVVAAVYTRVIGPGTADVAHFSFHLPQHYAGERLTLKARLLWRKFDRAYSEFAFANNPEGFAAFSATPDLPVSLIAENEVTLPVGAAQAESADIPSADWIRFNDYGIGLLLQGDTRGAARTFARVAELAPKRLDGCRNLARTALQDGDLDAAFKHLSRCEELVGGDAQTAWVWAVMRQEEGSYAESASAYRYVLNHFPEDRRAWRNLGRVLYLDSRFEEALEALEQAVQIDPEDRVVHYHRMLALRALGREDEAKVAEAAYQYFQIDESAQEVTRAYRLKHAHDNREVLKIHVHPLNSMASSKSGI